MSSYYNGSQEREWPGSEEDPDWCYVCDRPADDCACMLDPEERTLFHEMLAALEIVQEWGFIRKFPHDEQAFKMVNEAVAKAKAFLSSR